LLWLTAADSLLVSMSAEFAALALLYRFAPRRPTRFADVRLGALVAAVLLRAAQGLFVVYLRYSAASNAVYGALGGVMALLLWIYMSSCVFIYGACLCAVRRQPTG
jgi:YihY family inner membrane protein